MVALGSHNRFLEGFPPIWQVSMGRLQPWGLDVLCEVRMW